MNGTCPHHGEIIAWGPGHEVVGCRACAEGCSWKCYSPDCYSPRHYSQPEPVAYGFHVVKMQ